MYANQNRFTPLSVIASRLSRLRLILDNTPHKVAVYSEGQADEFAPLVELGCDLRCNESPIDTLRALAVSDILLTAKSSFSYIAGMLSHGIVLFEPFWHAKLPNWVDVDDWEHVAKAVRERGTR